MKKRFRFSITAKTIIMIFVFAAVLVEVAMTYFSFSISNRNRDSFFKMADNLSATTAQIINVDDFNEVKTKVKSIYDASAEKPLSDEWGSERWNAYVAQFKEVYNMPAHQRLLTQVKKIANANSELDCIYLAYVDPTQAVWIYLVDSAPEEDACPVGCIDALFEFNKGVIDNPARGFPAYITETKEYGWLVTSGAPIYDANKQVVGYACCDYSMNAVRASQRQSIVNLFIYLASTAVVITIIGIIVVNFTLIRPLKRLNSTANSYDISDPEKTHENFEKLKVGTRDELEDLSYSMKKMEHDVHQKIYEVTKAYEDLAESQNETRRITNIADHDSLTGLLSKSAYNREIEGINHEIDNGELHHLGIVMIDLNYLKQINDEQGHIAGDQALVKLSGIIKKVFTNSPIFRIGGDEFVVILRGQAYKKGETLVENFKKRIDELNSKFDVLSPENTSAALGLGCYDPSEDKNFDDVFAKADKAMYERKREMKERDSERRY